MRTMTLQALERLLEKNLPVFGDFVLKAFLALLVFLLLSKVIRHFCTVLRKTMEKSGVAPEIRGFFLSLARIAMYGMLLFSIFTYFGLQASSVAALVGGVSVGISLAIQGGLSNLAGGVIILFLKPFAVGDYIIEHTTKNEGTVSKIEMYYTTMVTTDNRKIVIPNSSLANNTITNVTAMDERKLILFADIAYEADLQLAKDILEGLLREDPAIHQDKDNKVFVESLMSSHVRLGLWAWVSTEDYIAAKWRINEEIKKRFDEAGIQIPYPQLDIHIKDKGSGR